LFLGSIFSESSGRIEEKPDGSGTGWHHNTPFFNGGLVIKVSPQFFCAATAGQRFVKSTTSVALNSEN